ncbi:Interleukin-20 receptor subunit alpha [Dissostichus eleginoides]|uniref:Interleukin-20 receptor subunit alpha n=1 Tax=Dissostichus eleginoides TaxID=100907 RepID=A0AAD9F5A5_DISEL|nr:Interleukin-20 receptor subunit alpha [Dissostichus eleginoides]
MWTVVVFLNLLGALHFTVSSSPPNPINVIFSSVDLRNVLEWLPGSGTLDDTQFNFTVQYAIYGDSGRAHWRAVPRCTDIVRRWCDLSNETGDPEQGYYARVRAVSRRASSSWVQTTRRFDPKWDTTFGPPMVSVEIKDNNATITLKGPMRYQPNAPMHILKWSQVPRYCITTPKDPMIGQLQRVVVGIVVPFVCMGMLVVVGYLLYNYLSGKGQKSPYILNLPTFHQPPLTFPPENPKPIIITIITIIKDQQPESGTPHSACPKKPTPGYASQRPQTPPAPEEPWDDLSVHYGFLATAPKIEIRGGNWNDLNCPVRGSYEKKECDVEDDHSGGPPLTNAQTEMSTLIQSHAWSLPVLTPLVSGQGASMGEVKGKEEEREFPGLLISPIPQMVFFHIPLNLLAKKEGGMGEEINGNMRVGTDGEMDESECEVLPLLSAYASQNTMQISHSDQSDDLPDDYGVLTMNTAHI